MHSIAANIAEKFSKKGRAVLKILSIDIPESPEGLKPISMSALGDVVLLAGANGSGKSRILRTIRNHVDSHLEPEKLVAITREVKQIGINLNQLDAQLQHQLAILETGLGQEDDIARTREVASDQRARLQQLNQILAQHHRLKLDREDVKPRAVEYQVQSPEMRAPGTYRVEELRQARDHMVSEFSLSISKEYGLAALQDLVDSLVYAEGEEKVDLEGDVARLKQLVRDLLGTELAWTGKDRITLFGRPLSKAGLSKGQTVLLQIALSIFFQRLDSASYVLLLDEPENHLHPAALIEVVDRIRSACPAAQLWIATHSLHLLAHFDETAIWFVREGLVERTGSNTLEVLKSVMAGDTGANELADFMALPAQKAATKFAAECLLEPKVVDTPLGDPQAIQVGTEIRALAEGKNRFRLLDFGAGKGRLMADIASMISALGDARPEFEYWAFDYQPRPEDRATCVARLSQLYGREQGHFVDGFQELRRINPKSVDAIVMCNTLHEIPIDQWLVLFGQDGVLTNLIAGDGHVLIVEDHVLKEGERAHDFGFIVLDNLELKALFGLQPEDDSVITIDHRDLKYAGRLKAHRVAASVLGNVTSESRSHAIREVAKSALLEMERLSTLEQDRRIARAYAFWAHQFANASLASKRF